MIEDISTLFNNLMEDLEANITDKAKKSKIKNELVELVALFISSSNNLVRIQDKQEMTLNKIKKLEKRVSQIEEDIYINDEDEDKYDKMHDNDYEFEIRCPYCDYDFIINEESQTTDEIECPKCHNIIELDWDEASSCTGDCNGCAEHCYQDKEDTKNSLNELSEENEEYNVDNDKGDKLENNQNSNQENNTNKPNKENKDKNNNEDDM